MTVQELIDQLKQLPPSAEAWLYVDHWHYYPIDSVTTHGSFCDLTSKQLRNYVAATSME